MENITLTNANENVPGTHDYFRNHFENFVFCGGGSRGIALGGALSYLEKYNLTNQIKRVAGSSAGAIVAGAFAVGYKGSEINAILQNTNFETFMDHHSNVFYDTCDFFRFIRDFGFFKGDVFESWYGNLLGKKTGNADITFLEIYERYGKELVVTGTCLNTSETHYYHYKKYPNMLVRKAVRISMSIPGIFAACKEPETGNIMVDGGVLNNYPIWVFDGKYIGDPDVTDDDVAKSKTLGFKLMSSQEKDDYKLYHAHAPINNIKQYVEALINSMLIQIERAYIRPGYWEKTVPIATFNVSSFNFDLDSKTKNELIQSGYDAVCIKVGALGGAAK